MSTSNELDDIAKSLKLYRFKSELIESMETDSKNDTKNTQLKKTINELEGKMTIKNKTKIQDVFGDIDKQVYAKPWKKLPDFHKIVKIKEYVTEKYKDEKKLQVETLLLEAIEKKELNNDLYVTYDQSIQKITDIPVMKLDTETNTYKLEFPKKRKPKHI